MTAHVQEQLSAFMDGALPTSEQSAVQEHLRVCPSCARLLNELTAVDEAARELPVNAPAGYFDTFAARVRRQLEGERRPARTHAVPRWAWAVAAGLLLAVVTPLTLRHVPVAPPLADQLVLPGSAKQDHPSSAGPPATAGRGAGSAPAAPESKRVAEGTRERVVAPAPAKDAPSGSLGQAVSAPTPAPREEDAPRQAPTPARADVPKPQAAPLAVPAPVLQEATAGKKEELPAAFGEARDQAGAEAARETSPFAQEPASASAPRRAKLRGAADNSRTSDTAAAPSASIEAEYARLQRRAVTDLGTARALREAWRNFGLRNPESRYADEARVGTIAAGVEAVRLGGDSADRELLDRDAAGYLERDESKQKDRVRRILKRLDPEGN